MCPIKRRLLKKSVLISFVIFFSFYLASCNRCINHWLGPTSVGDYVYRRCEYRLSPGDSDRNTFASRFWMVNTDSTFITGNHYADGYLWNAESDAIYHFEHWEWDDPLEYPFYGSFVCGDPATILPTTISDFWTPQSILFDSNSSLFEYDQSGFLPDSAPFAIVLAGDSWSKVVFRSAYLKGDLPAFDKTIAFDVPPSHYLSNQKFSQLLLKTCRERYCGGRSSDCPREKTTFSFALCGGAYDEMIIENPGKASIYAWDVETGETLSLGHYSWSGSVDYPFYDFSVIDGKRTDYPLCEFPWTPFRLSEEKQTRTFGITVRFDDDYGCFDADFNTRFYSIRHIEDKDGFSERISPADFDSAWVYRAPTIE